MPATEDGLIYTEVWDDVPMGPGQEPAKIPYQINRDTDELRPKPGHEHYIVVHRPPERPA